MARWHFVCPFLSGWTLGCLHFRVIMRSAAADICELSFCVDVYSHLGFPGGSENKESARNVGYLYLIPGLGKAPEEGNGYPLLYSCLVNSMDRGDWQAISQWGHRVTHD